MDPKQQFLDAYDRELATTLRVLRAFPADQAELRPHPKAKSARELAWVFVLERGLGQRVWNDELSKGMPGKMPEAPEDFHAIIDAYEKAAAEYRQLVAAASPDDLAQQVTFFTAPKTMGKISRMEWIWFLLHDEIHHRGQFSVYLRMADGKVPSIYGPSADEPWI
jgi:uncharacterized damage-inducible protein DinB